jgi:hypothetical protein
MKKHTTSVPQTGAFRRVEAVGLALPHVEAATRYDGCRILKACGCFMAGLATHPSAERNTLVVRIALDERAWLLEDAPDVYYVTDYYRKYPVVLVRLARIDREALRDLLAVSWRLAMAKAGNRRRAADRRHARGNAS